MAATLSVVDYLQHFFLNRDHEISLGLVRKNEVPESQQSDALRSRSYSDNNPPASPTKVLPVSQQNYGIMLAHVYQVMRNGAEHLIYSKRTTGNRNVDVFGIFTHDMIGSRAFKASQSLDGRLSRASSVSDVSSILDSEDGELQPHTTVKIQLVSSRTPSNIGSSHLLTLLEHCRKHKIRAQILLKFAHTYSWDNKYNREGIEKLHSKGIKFVPMSCQQIMHTMIDDLKESIEAFDQLETCRGTIFVDGIWLDRAVRELRQSITTSGDFYAQDQQEQLNEIIGRESVIPIRVPYSQTAVPAVFSLETYRDYLLLQNTDVMWSKLKVSIAKISGGTTKEDSVYDQIYCESSEKATKNNKKRLVDKKSIWNAIGKKVTMVDLSECESIVITVNALMSEYCGRTGWVEDITQLHGFLRDMVEEGELYKVAVKTVAKYANTLEAPIYKPTRAHRNPDGGDQKLVNGVVNGYGVTTVGFPKGMSLDCMHVQDILFEMLEDLEDNIRHLGTVDCGRGANLTIDPDGLAHAIGLLNRAIKVIIGDHAYSMNDDFEDQYADEMNGT